MKNVIVVGGGASGMMAAYAAAKNGNKVILLEKNEKLGKKIYITGKGRGNLTNHSAPQDFLSNVLRNSKFLTSAIYSFTPDDMIEFMENNGVPVKTERGGRVFPQSEHASDITKALTKACNMVGVDVHLNEKVVSFGCLNSTISDILTEKGRYSADCIIVATGGLSYPTTGSDGDGYKFAKMAGHSVSPLFPSLVGVNLRGNAHSAMQGLSLKNVVLSAEREGKTVYSGLGEMLFTHFGVSGPLVLSLSAQLAREKISQYALYIDLKPALTYEQLDKRILRDFSANPNKSVRNVLGGLLPSAMISSVLACISLPETKPVNAITKAERSALASVLKKYPLFPTSFRGFDEAVITCGGVDVREINPKTMESKKISGLYFCGEVLDVDAYTGGYNLQIAFSTGYVAGNSIH